MIIIERILFFKKISIFSSLSSYELRKVAEVLSEEEFSSGEILFSEGDFGDCMYLIVDGKISIFTGKSPAIKILAAFEKGAFFGEMGLYDDKPRAASAMADLKSHTLVLRKGEFCDLISEFPMVALGIMKELNNRIRATNKKLHLIEKNVVDSSSKLYSRDYFLDCVKNQLSRASKEKSIVSFLVIRLRQVHFKDKKNDHTESQKLVAELIKELGIKLEEFIRESDMLCRYDTESIVVMIPESNRKGTLRFQARITDDLNRVLLDFESSHNLYSDIEFRTVVFPDDGDNFDEITQKIEEI
jgi:diguanylate cyclase (GGDEF)-like protein